MSYTQQSSRATTGSRNTTRPIKILILLLTTIAVFTLSLGPAQAAPHRNARPIQEPLLEAPFQVVPEEISYEDYRDANRRLGLGFTYAIFPGGMHFYAAEPVTGWTLLGTAAVGVGLIVAGASTARDVPQNIEGEYLTTTIGNKTYYRIPVESVDGGTVSTSYDLKEAEDTRKGLTNAGAGLVSAGAIALIGSYIWDMYHGITVIEQKRDLARFKIGQVLARQKREKSASQPSIGIQPLYDPHSGAGGLQMQLRF